MGHQNLYDLSDDTDSWGLWNYGTGGAGVTPITVLGNTYTGFFGGETSVYLTRMNEAVTSFSNFWFPTSPYGGFNYFENGAGGNIFFANGGRITLDAISFKPPDSTIGFDGNINISPELHKDEITYLSPIQGSPPYRPPLPLVQVPYAGVPYTGSATLYNVPLQSFTVEI